MLDWEVPSSPSSRSILSVNNAGQHWSTNFPTSPTSSWSSFSTLQPSASIWGPQIQKPVQPFRANHAFCGYKEEVPLSLNYCSTLSTSPQRLGSIRYAQDLRERQQRVPSAPSLAPSSSNSSTNSSHWGDDSYMASPPPSPESSVVFSNPPSPQMSPLQKAAVANQILKSAADTDDTDEITISASCGPLYLVQFKGGRVDVFTAPGTSYYAVGDSVMVDADRGSDLGEIMQANVSRHDAACFKQRQNKDRSRALNASHVTSSEMQGHGDHTVFVPKQIIGPATPSNIRDMTAKTRDEAAAVALCNTKVAERGLNMEIVDAEYQWDRRKLTFFYNADTRVDFRDLVRDLFRVYKTRIWMCATIAR